MVLLGTAGTYSVLAGAAVTERATVLAAARAKNPERFATTNDPKILTIPETAWINKP